MNPKGFFMCTILPRNVTRNFLLGFTSFLKASAPFLLSSFSKSIMPLMSWMFRLRSCL